MPCKPSGPTRCQALVICDLVPGVPARREPLSTQYKLPAKSGTPRVPCSPSWLRLARLVAGLVCNTACPRKVSRLPPLLGSLALNGTYLVSCTQLYVFALPGRLGTNVGVTLQVDRVKGCACCQTSWSVINAVNQCATSASHASYKKKTRKYSALFNCWKRRSIPPCSCLPLSMASQSGDLEPAFCAIELVCLKHAETWTSAVCRWWCERLDRETERRRDRESGGGMRVRERTPKACRPLVVQGFQVQLLFCRHCHSVPQALLCWHCLT